MGLIFHIRFLPFSNTIEEFERISSMNILRLFKEDRSGWSETVSDFSELMTKIYPLSVSLDKSLKYAGRFLNEIFK